MINITRWVSFNDPAWESSGWGGWVVRVGLSNIPTTFIQLDGAGSIKMNIVELDLFNQATIWIMQVGSRHTAVVLSTQVFIIIMSLFWVVLFVGLCL